MLTPTLTTAAVRRHKNAQLRLVRAEIERELHRTPAADVAVDLDTDRRCAELVVVERLLVEKLALLP